MSFRQVQTLQKGSQSQIKIISSMRRVMYIDLNSRRGLRGTTIFVDILVLRTVDIM